MSSSSEENKNKRPLEEDDSSFIQPKRTRFDGIPENTQTEQGDLTVSTTREDIQRVLQTQNVESGSSMLVDESIGVVPLPAVDKRESDPPLYLTQFWKQNVSKRQKPQFELKQDDTTKKWGCSIHLFIPPSSTRSFTVDMAYSGKREAKDAACRMAIKYGVPEEAQQAATREQEKKIEAQKQAAAQRLAGKQKRLNAQKALVEKAATAVQEDLSQSGGDQPISLLYQTMAQNLGHGNTPNFEYGMDPLTQFHTVKLTVTVLPNLIKTYTSTEPQKSRKLAKENVCRVAIKDGIIKLIQEENSLDAKKNRGEITGCENKNENPSQQLHMLCVTYLNGGSALVYEYECPPTGLFGASVKIKMSSDDFRFFRVEPTFKTKKDARREVSRVALVSGIAAEMEKSKQEKKASTGPVVGGDGKQKANSKLIPKPGAHLDKDADLLENAVGYLNLCFQTWHGSVQPLAWEFSVSPQSKTGATLFVRLSASLHRKYTVPPIFKGKKDAKEAVAKKAIKEGLLGLIRPKKVFDSQPRPTQSGIIGRGGINSRGGFPSRGSLFGKMSGIFKGNGPFSEQAFNGQSQLPASQFGIHAPGFQLPQVTPVFGGMDSGSSNIFGLNSQQLLDLQQQNAFLIQQRLQQQQAEQQRLEAHNNGIPFTTSGLMHPQQPSNTFSWGTPNPPGWNTRPNEPVLHFVQQLDDFCQDWMGPGHLPEYEVHRDDRSGLFGCALRISITTTNVKSFWTNHEFAGRNDAQEACAHSAIQSGIIDIIKREFVKGVNGLPSLGGLSTAPQSGYGGFNNNLANHINPSTPEAPIPDQNQDAIISFDMNKNLLFDQTLSGSFNHEFPNRGRGGPVRGKAHVTAPLPATKNVISPTPKLALSKTQIESSVLHPSSDAKLRKGESAVTTLNKTCQYIIGTEPQDMPEYEFLTDTTGSKFGAVVHVPLDSNQTTMYSVPSTFINKKEAKEAVAKLAIDQGVLKQIKNKAEKRIDQIQASLKEGNHVYSPLKIGPKPSSERPKTFVHQLQEYCRSHNMPKAVFTSETGSATSGSEAKDQVLRVWVVIGDLKFELDKERFGKEKDGKERLASRVLKHLQKEEGERLATATTS